MAVENPPNTLGALVRERAAAASRSTAVAAPGRPDMDFGGLLALCGATARQLHGLGVGAQDRVALVLPDGPEAATAFVSVAASAACGPLNPRLTPVELSRQIDDLRPRVFLLPEDAAAATLDVARASGASVVALRFDAGAPAGLFAFRDAIGAATSAPPGPDSTALVLHTSGTTSRPKRVGLSHANLVASARHIASSLALGPDDRCLDVMPLFHIHGLVAGVLAPLASGGSVACPGSFEAVRFFEWLDALRPTWYTAVPTMHQAILVHSAKHASEIARARLRFVRSSSAPLPPSVLARLESAFGVPVIEAYGMTEAAHQMASNPLPPGQRKPGSVGLPAGPELAILDAAGRRLPPGGSGEVAIRGPNVMAGYEDNAAANADAFHDGWFRTGDLGAFDADGYLFLQGRLKELINRGGEKIAPREVEEVLLEHPAVAEAVAFPVPDPDLGETLGVAIVLREGTRTSLRELRAHAADKLAHFKLPQHVALVAEIPKGPTGKLQRSFLAERLGIGAATEQDVDRSPARTPLEERLCALWAEVLGVDRPGIHAGFLELGGDSLTATRMLGRVREEHGTLVSLAQFFETPSVAGLAALVTASRARGPEAPTLDDGR